MEDIQRIAQARVAMLKAEMDRQLQLTKAHFEGRIAEVEFMLKSSMPPGPADGDAAQPVVVEAVAN